jgi:AcrR family transcriptional regulator
MGPSDVNDVDFTREARGVNTVDMPYHHGDLRRALVEHSVTLVREHGVDGFSLRAAARAAGVDPAAVYRHFADRDDLMRAVAAAGFAELTAGMTAATEAARGAAARFVATGTAYVGFAVANPEYFSVMFGRHGADVRGSGAYALLLTTLGDLAAEHPLRRDAAGAAVVAWSAVHGLATLAVAGAVPAAGLDGAVDDVTATVLAGLLR